VRKGRPSGRPFCISGRDENPRGPRSGTHCGLDAGVLSERSEPKGAGASAGESRLALRSFSEGGSASDERRPGGLSARSFFIWCPFENPRRRGRAVACPEGTTTSLGHGCRCAAGHGTREGGSVSYVPALGRAMKRSPAIGMAGLQGSR
jgi:hypothetical protein